MSPKISIIVPVYKVEKYLPRCINSILAQTFTDFELLLIDDGSPDKSGEICDEYAQKDSRIRVFHKENGGVSSARNVGLDNAKGEWVCFVDSDDYIENIWFSFLGKKTIKSIDLICFGATYHNSTKVVYSISPKSHLYTQEKITDFITKYSNTCIINAPWTKFFKRTIIQNYNLRFEEDLSIGEDLLFNLKFIAITNSILVYEFCAYNYYIYPNSLLRGRHSFEELRRLCISISKVVQLILKSHSLNIAECKGLKIILFSCYILAIRRLFEDDIIESRKTQLKELYSEVQIKNFAIPYSIYSCIQFVIIHIPNITIQYLANLCLGYIRNIKSWLVRC